MSSNAAPARNQQTGRSPVGRESTVVTTRSTRLTNRSPVRDVARAIDENIVAADDIPMANDIEITRVDCDSPPRIRWQPGGIAHQDAHIVPVSERLAQHVATERSRRAENDQVHGRPISVRRATMVRAREPRYTESAASPKPSRKVTAFGPVNVNVKA